MITVPYETEPVKDGTIVKILQSGFHRAKVAECRGPIGPKGAFVYRVLVTKKPRPMYIEVLRDQMEILEEPRNPTETQPQGSPQTVKDGDVSKATPPC